MQATRSVEVRHKAILFTINKLFHIGMSPQELLEATQGFWVVGPRKDQAEYAMAVYQGIVLEVYRILCWYPAGTIKFKTRDSSEYKNSARWEFAGRIAYNIRDQYVGSSVGKGGQNPVRYLNC